jgi:hypothetical protein
MHKMWSLRHGYDINTLRNMSAPNRSRGAAPSTRKVFNRRIEVPGKNETVEQNTCINGWKEATPSVEPDLPHSARWAWPWGMGDRDRWRNHRFGIEQTLHRVGRDVVKYRKTSCMRRLVRLSGYRFLALIANFVVSGSVLATVVVLFAHAT